jgi:hypothetical protein
MIDSLSEFEKQLIYSAFYKEVNMAPREIENLVGIVEAPPQPDASATAAAPPGSAESDLAAPPAPEAADPPGLTEDERIGRHLVRIKRKKKEELTERDFVQMRGAINHIRRNAGRPPENEEKRELWRHRLMVRGFNPEKAKQPAAAAPAE